MKYTKAETRRSALVTITALVIALVFFAVSVFSSVAINTNLKVLSEHPFSVSSAIFKLKVAISGSQIRLTRLTTYNQAQDVTIVQNAIKELNIDNDEYTDYIAEYYLGPHSQVQHLEEVLEQIYSLQDVYCQNATSQTLAQNVNFIETSLTPLYDEVNKTTDTMMAFINNTVKRLSKESNDIQLLTVFFSLLMSAFFVGFAAIYQTSVNKKIKEISYRDFLFKMLSENVDSVFMIYNVKNRHMEYVTFNSKRILGIDNLELEREKVDLFDFCDKDECSALMQALKSETLRTPIQKECMVLNPVLNKSNCIQISMTPVLENGEVTRYILSLADLAEIKRNQQILRDALINAQNSSAAKSEFLSRMSHEIRTPMNAVIGMATIATTAMANPAKLENCLTKIMLSSKHLLHLINDVLDMSKIESGKLALSVESFALADVIAEVSNIIYSQAQAKNQSYNVVSSVSYDTLIGDVLRLNQILLNVLSNAVKYTAPGGKIKLNIQQVPYKIDNMVRLRFTITDNGIGMSEEFMQKLFTPFEQETQAIGGTGLGLAITKNLITLAGGSIYVQSTLGQGSSFNVEIPFGVSSATPNTTDKAFADLKILVADDDQDTCEHTTIILQRLGIYANWVLSGLDAVEETLKAYNANESYDVIFIDWKMQDIDGIEATRRIRKVVGPETLIIIISSFNWPEIEHEARLAGASGFISKPMFQSTIFNTLTRVIKNGGEQPASSTLPTADFTGKRFLLAEDNALNMEIAKELLELTGAQIKGAVNGQEAVQMFSQSAKGYYDAILMDVQMPILDGYAATKAIRALPHISAKSVPIIAMTANAFSEDVAAAINAGMNAHIAKPIDLDLMYKVLAKAMNDNL